MCRSSLSFILSLLLIMISLTVPQTLLHQLQLMPAISILRGFADLVGLHSHAAPRSSSASSFTAEELHTQCRALLREALSDLVLPWSTVEAGMEGHKGEESVNRRGVEEPGESDGGPLLIQLCREQLTLGSQCLAFLSHQLGQHLKHQQMAEKSLALLRNGPSMMTAMGLTPRKRRASRVFRSSLLASTSMSQEWPGLARSSPKPSVVAEAGKGRGIGTRMGREAAATEAGTERPLLRHPAFQHQEHQQLILGLPMPIVWHPATTTPLDLYPDGSDESEIARSPTFSGYVRRGDHSAQPGSIEPNIPSAPTLCRELSKAASTSYSLSLFHTALDVTNLLPLKRHRQGQYGSSEPCGSPSLYNSNGPPVDRRGAPSGAKASAFDPEVLPVPDPAPDWFIEPSLATGLLLMSFACCHPSSSLSAPSDPHTIHAALPSASPQSLPSLSSSTCRLNWRLLHDYPPEAHGAALWSVLGDWRKAAVLAFTVHNMVGAMSPSPRADPGRVDRMGRWDVSSGGQIILTDEIPTHLLDNETEKSSTGADTGGAPHTAVSVSGGCLRVGLSILRQQVARCHGMEVQEACITLHELVAIPRHSLGQGSAVYGLMLQSVSAEPNKIPGQSPLSPFLAHWTLSHHKK